ncbi:MAG: glycine-rich protein, partial [Bacteroidota bacterium]
MRNRITTASQLLRSSCPIFSFVQINTLFVVLTLLTSLPLHSFGQSPPTVSGTTAICEGISTILTASGEVGATFTWYDAPIGGNLLASTAEFTTPNLNSTTSYYVSQTVSTSTSARTTVEVSITPIPSPNEPTNVVASPGTICTGESTDLSATVDATAGYQVFWYDAMTGGNLLATTTSGSPYTVSPSTTTTYYAQSEIQVFEQIFNYTGGVQTFTVPAGITELTIDAYGARGGNTYSTNGPGLCGRVQATMSVIPGQVLNIYVGGQGQSYAGYSSTLLGGWNGGGNGTSTGQGGGGGGATDIRINGTGLNERVLVAGGAGGKGPICSAIGLFPHGGGLTGGNGSYCSSGSGELKRGRGGTQTGGGRPGCWYGGSSCGTWGSFGQGGNGGSVSGNGRAGGGGGGWYGGGGGTYNGDGGGGSSYTDAGLFSDVIHTQGVQNGNGQLIISYTEGIDCASDNRVPVTVTVNELPNVVASADTYSCPGDGVTISATGADSYVWEPGSLSGASILVDPASTTTYTVTGTNSHGCTFTDQVIVHVSNLSVSGDVQLCLGSTTTLTASGAVNYTWEPGTLTGASINVSPASTTIYTVTSSDPSGCTESQSMTVTVNSVPTLSTSNDTVVGKGFPVTLSATGADTYIWNPGNLSSASVTVNPTTSTTYTVTGYYSGTNCSSTADVEVGAVDLPTVSGTMTRLVGQSTSLTAAGPSGVTFEWFDAATGGNSLATTALFTTPSLNANQTYYVALTDGGFTSPRIPVNVTAVDTSLSAIMATSTICPGSSIDLKASLPSPGVIHWYDAPSGGNLVGTVDRNDSLSVSPGNTQVYYARGETQQKTTTFNYTGAAQTFTVPEGVTNIEIDAYGAQGGNTYSTNGPGLGGRVQASMNVTPGQVLHIYVGGQGQSYAGYSNILLGGWNGGGNGTSTGQGGGGGGSTDIRIDGTALTDRVLVAGGAGGKGPTCSSIGLLPHGGGLTGGNGSYCSGGSGELKRGRGGSQTGGGRPGCWHGGSSCGGWGSFGRGGNGGSVSGNGRAGGGGGGWYGGGGGTYHGDGGGGSSYTQDRIFQNIIHTQGVRSGNGILTITYSANGNGSNTLSTTITVEDITPPVPDVANLPDAIGEYEVTLTPPTATDECGGLITATTTAPLYYD